MSRPDRAGDLGVLTLRHDEPAGATRVAVPASRNTIGDRANANARRKFAPRYLLHTLRNIPVIAGSADVTALSGAWTGVPAVVVAAGPSLDQNIDALRHAHGRAVVIAVDTALRPLLEAGIEPDLVVALDPSELNARHLRDLPDTSRTWLVAEASLHPGAFDQFGGRIFTFAVSDHQPWPWLRSAGLGRGPLRAWGSVLTSALDLALRCGCDPIVFAGADLAFSGQRPYCRGTVYEHDWAARVGRGESLTAIWASATERRNTVTVPDVSGRPVRTSAALLQFRDWIVEQSVAHQGRRFINGTGAGALFGGRVVQQTLADALRPLPGGVWQGSPAVGAAWRTGRAGRENDRQRLTRALVGLADASPQQAPLASWLDFAGGGVSVDQIRTALRDAAEWRDAPPHRTTSPSTTPTRFSPERVLAIRRAITADNGPAPAGVTDPPGGDALPFAAVLTRAGQLLRTLAHTSPLVDTTASTDPFAVAGMPASRAFSWHPAAVNGVLEYEHALAALLRQPGGNAALRAELSQTRSSGDGATRALTGQAQHDAAGRLALASDLLSVVAVLEGVCEGTSGSRNLRTMAAVARFHAARQHALAGSGYGPGDSLLPTGMLVRVAGSGCVEPASAVHPTERSLVLSGGGVGDEGLALPLPSGPEASLASGTEPAWLRAVETLPPALWVQPRVLNSPALPCLIGSTLDDATAIFAVLNQHHSVSVDADGRMRDDAAWPRPIHGQVRWGARGAIAWCTGETPYVMWRERPEGDVCTEALPFSWGLAFPQPGGGTWWTSTSGLWSWTPGGMWHRLVDTPPLSGLRLDAAGVRLDPRITLSDMARDPRASAFTWRPGSDTVAAVPLGPEGACWSTAETAGWTALAYRHAGLILLRHRNGEEYVLACRLPFYVAWAGPSLVVSTAGNELLLFPQLRTQLEDRRG